MAPYVWPDPELMQRLIRRVRARDERGHAFIAGGEAIAMAILAGGEEGTVGQAFKRAIPDWTEALADAMLGSLLLTVDETVDEATVSERVRLSIAAAVLTVVRPHAQSACDAAIDTWMGWGIDDPDPDADDDTLVGWTLLCLLRRDGPGALRAVRSLHGDDGVGLILQDWTTSVIKSEPLRREAQSFHHLRTHMGHFESRPTHLLMGALVIQTGAGLCRAGVLRWLDAIAIELSTVGTSRCTPVPAAHRF